MKKLFIAMAAILVVAWLVDQELWQAPAVEFGGPGPTPAWPPEVESELELAAENLATNYYVVLDGSGSMRDAGCSGSDPKIVAALEALEGFVRSLPPDVNLGLLAFDGNGVKERLAIRPADADAFSAELQKVRPSARTPLKTAISQGYDALTNQGRRQLGYGEYHLVVVTDGEASQGEDPTAVVNRILAESPVVIHTIGFCISSDHSLNQGGRVLYRTAQNAAELREGLEQVLAEAPDFTVTRF